MHVARDRASNYSKAISTGAPKAIQIADKFHIIKNLGDHITKEIRRHYKAIKNNFIPHNKEYFGFRFSISHLPKILNISNNTNLILT